MFANEIYLTQNVIREKKRENDKERETIIEQGRGIVYIQSSEIWDGQFAKNNFVV